MIQWISLLTCVVWFGRVKLTIIPGTSLFMINLKSQHFRIIESFSKMDSDFPSRSDIQHGHLTMIILDKLGKVLCWLQIFGIMIFPSEDYWAQYSLLKIMVPLLILKAYCHFNTNRISEYKKNPMIKWLYFSPRDTCHRTNPNFYIILFYFFFKAFIALNLIKRKGIWHGSSSTGRLFT